MAQNDFVTGMGIGSTLVSGPANAIVKNRQQEAEFLIKTKQAEAAAKEQEWKRVTYIVDKGTTLVADKNVPKDTKLNTYKNMGKLLTPWIGYDPYEGMDIKTVDFHDDETKQVNGLMDLMRKKPEDAQMLMGEISKVLSSGRARFAEEKDKREAFEAITKPQEDWAKTFTANQANQAKQATAQQAAQQRVALQQNKPEMSAPDAMKRQSTINNQITNLSKGLVYDDATGKTVQINLAPEAKTSSMRNLANEWNAANEYLPPDKQRKMLVQSDFEALRDTLSPEKKAEAIKLLRSGKWTLAFDK